MVESFYHVFFHHFQQKWLKISTFQSYFELVLQLQRFSDSFYDIFNQIYDSIALLHSKSSQLNQIFKADQARLYIPIIEPFIRFFTALRQIVDEPWWILPEISIFNKIFLFDAAKDIVDGIFRETTCIHFLEFILIIFPSGLAELGSWLGQHSIFKWFFVFDAIDGENLLHLFDISWPFIEISMSKNIYQCCFYFWINIFLDVLQKNM